MIESKSESIKSLDNEHAENMYDSTSPEEPKKCTV